MKRFAFSKAVIATALIGACASAFAADTAQIVVKGKFVPAACSIDITGGGIFDYGVMTKADVLAMESNAETTQTILTPEKTATLTIDCGQTDTSVAFTVLDALYNTATPDFPNSGFKILNGTISGVRKHGLGVTTKDGSPVNIGQYGAVLDNASVRLTIGGQPNVLGQTTVSNTDGDSWVNNGQANVIHGSGFNLQSFRRTTSSTGAPPEPFAHATAGLHVQAALNRLDDLPEQFSFNGLTTLTLVYLDAHNKPLP